ncbi:hypothetical protein THAOC_17052 [Thalassiosira oceanica]|uniref:Uncharacterized protein n=1 Tax=Thalassiosira oceanica TaxID=159749 RepID=K0SAP1_THAOC|nr:hypothetical protein THAOC_17052 [Thalassiosira oceanica]|eukprot:EJK62340.1 hypothetical protein THAOC_17052 [Thalassiosira oceanica]
MSSSVSATTQSLPDILPWGSPVSSSEGSNDAQSSRTSTLLVTDSVSADGRFILHALALQYLSTRHSGHVVRPEDQLLLEGSVLWISSAPVSEKQLLLCMRKGLQHNLGGSGSRIGSSSGLIGRAGDDPSDSSGRSTAGRINVISVPLELADAALEGETVDLALEDYAKKLHARVVRWLKDRSMESSCSNPSESERVTSRAKGPTLLVIDNATALASLMGDRLAGSFVASVRGSMTRHSAVASKQDSPSSATSITVTNLLAIRATSPDDGGLYQIGGALQGDKIRAEHARILRPWLGMGSGISNPTDEDSRVDVLELEEKSNYQLPSIVHKWGLYEMADGIVDVSPLESGYARDVLGRLSFLTTFYGQGWWGTKTGNEGKATNMNETFSINYKCDDSGIRTMRLRST